MALGPQRRLGAVGHDSSKGSPPQGAAQPPGRLPNRAPGCTKLRENRHVTIGISFRYRHTLSNYSNGRFTQRVYHDKKRRFGKLSVGGATCKRPGKKGWKVISPVGVGYTSQGLSRTATSRAKG